MYKTYKVIYELIKDHRDLEISETIENQFCVKLSLPDKTKYK